MIERKADLLIEVSWEVCNKVGGINTVLRSKADLVNEFYPNYILIGPYIADKAKFDFTPEDAPSNFKAVIDDMRGKGLNLYYGSWNIKSNPKVILIDFSGLLPKKNDIKKFLWDKYQIDSLNSRWDFEEPILFGYAAGMIIESISKQCGGKRCVAQMHEWMAGSAILYLKAQQGAKRIGTVFTTHATMLGRTMCGNNRNLYEELGKFSPDDEARKYGVQDKHLTEKACALNADVFTTVSEITGMEAEKLFGKKPDVLLFNGLEAAKFPTFEEVSIKHEKSREIIREFISYHFFPHYYFDLSQTLLFFIIGRYEYKNKGIDIMIKALARLNERMKREDHKKTIIAFFWIPRDVNGTKLELSQNKLNFNQIHNFVQDNSEVLQTRIVNNIFKTKALKKVKGDDVTTGIFDEEAEETLNKLKINFFKAGNPLLVTHNLPGEGDDIIIRDFIANGLDNREDDKVKVIFYPVYLTGIDGLTDLAYYDAMVACHLGIFPSYYEPWGYTPLESAALGVPSLTTDLSGFGRFLQSNTKMDGGIYILKRFMRAEEQVINDFADIMYNYASLPKMGRVEEKIKAKELSIIADWHTFIEYYYQAHNLAIDKVNR